MEEKEISEDVWIEVTERPNYLVNCAGVIKSIERIGITKKGWSRRMKEKVLKPQNNGRGYLFVNFERTDRAKYIHRVVASAFVPNPDNLPQVNHKDLNKQNNHYKNLEWVDQQGNSKHAFANGRCSLPKDTSGSKNGNSKLTSDKVLKIRELEGKKGASEIAKEFGITRDYVYVLFKRKKWNHI